MSLPPPTPSEAAFEARLAEFARSAQRPHDRALDGAAPDAARADAFLDDLFARRESFLVRDTFGGIAERGEFFTKVFGVSFEGRQDVVAGLAPGHELMLERRPENAHDPNAIAVLYGELQIGFLRREIAAKLAPVIDGGERYTAVVTDRTGGRDGRSFGVNVHVRRRRAAMARSAVRDGVRDVSNDAIRHALIGDRPLRDAQAAVLERVAAGRNTLAVLGTGRGKSFCFQFPASERALANGAKTIVVYPLRALANDQFEAMRRRLGPLGVRIFRANGSIDGEERAELLEALDDGTWDIVCATPEFLSFHLERFGHGVSRPSLVVVDEAHHVVDATHRPAYGKLSATIAALGSPQVLALTATADGEKFAKIVETLGIDAWVIDPTVRENLHVVDARGTVKKLEYIAERLRKGGKAIVYCNSRAEVTKLAERLRAERVERVAFYHAGMGTAERGQVEEYFRSGEIAVVVATSAFGEGIDLPDVRNVFLYHLNFNFTEFNQQSGRAGRDGDFAEIHLLFAEADRRINDYIIAHGAPAIGTLREIYRGLRGIASEQTIRMTYDAIATTLALDMADARTIGIALRIFEEAGLVTIGSDDDGRFVRMHEARERVDLTKNERYAEGQAERVSFEEFCSLVLGAPAPLLEQIVNRPIYPQNVALRR